jgi:hypothetical protein
MNLNKRGDSKYLSPYWFVIIFLVSAGIFLMVYLFYGTPYDVRGIEARILTNQVADCVSYAGRINSNLISNGIISENKETFLETCHLNFDSSDWTIGQYYAEVNFYKFEKLDNSIFTIKKGNSDWIGNCEMQETKKYEKLAQCNEGSFYSTDDMNNQYIIKILTVVRKSEKNVKL